MEGIVFAVIFTGVTGWLRADYDKKGLGWKTRLFRGVIFGTVIGLVVVFLGYLYREANEVPPLSLLEVLALFGLFLGLGSFSLLKWPKDDGTDVRAMLDDPRNITPQQRVDMAKAKYREQQSASTHNK